MRVAWICDTAYQILNFVNYVMSCPNKGAETDVYIGHQFANSTLIEKQILEERICRNVYAYTPEKNNNLFDKIKNSITFPVNRINEMLTVSSEELRGRYDTVFLSIATPFATNFFLCSQPKQLFAFDDGSGSYYGNLGLPSRNRCLFSFLLGRNLYKMKPEALYLNNPAFCKCTTMKDIRPLPKLRDENHKKWECIQRIFDYKGAGVYQAHRMIFFAQPNDMNISGKECVDREIFKKLRIYGKELVVRPHPRQKKNEFQDYQMNFCVDNELDMWEIVCADHITNEHILIGAFSTAQLTPKMLFNKEPYLLFLYELYPNLISRKRKKGIKELIQRISDAYSDPSKIITAKSCEDITIFINSVLQRTKSYEDK